MTQKGQSRRTSFNRTMARRLGRRWTSVDPVGVVVLDHNGCRFEGSRKERDMMTQIQGLLGLVGALAFALILASSCTDRVENPKPTGDRKTCEVYCARWTECKDADVGTEESCVEDCVGSPDWGGACAEEWTSFMECAVLPDNACPTFEQVGVAGGEGAPCFDESNDYSICFNKEHP
jgi:hypothetical protein